MSESVEQAALRRARAPKDADRLIALIEKIVLTVEGLNALDDSRAADIARHDDELAEIRDALLALTNRIESVTQLAIDSVVDLREDVANALVNGTTLG